MERVPLTKLSSLQFSWGQIRFKHNLLHLQSSLTPWLTSKPRDWQYNSEQIYNNGCPPRGHSLPLAVSLFLNGSTTPALGALLLRQFARTRRLKEALASMTFSNSHQPLALTWSTLTCGHSTRCACLILWPCPSIPIPAEWRFSGLRSSRQGAQHI